MVSHRRSRSRIAVYNTNIEGVRYRSPLPTFVLDTVGLTPERAAWELSAVGLLQTMSSVFRVVLITDQPSFAEVRSYGWPVEHIMSPEHQANFHSAARSKEYFQQREAIALANYENAAVIRPDKLSTLAFQVAAKIDDFETYQTVAKLVGGPPSSALTVTELSTPTIEILQSNGRLIMEGIDGRVEIVAPFDCGRAIFVVGGSLGENHEARAASVPSWINVIHASFDAQSTLEFESYVYSNLARLIGRDLTIVFPWRVSAVRSRVALFWIDLGVDQHSDVFRVLPEYAHTYSVLEPSGGLNWESAKKYGAVRKISRARSESYVLYSS